MEKENKNKSRLKDKKASMKKVEENIKQVNTPSIKKEKIIKVDLDSISFKHIFVPLKDKFNFLFSFLKKFMDKKILVLFNSTEQEKVSKV